MEKVNFDEEKHIYTVGEKEYPSVTTVLEMLTAKCFSLISKEVLDAAKERGTAVHEATEMLDCGAECEVAYEYAGYVDAWMAFKRDYGFKPEGIEERFADTAKGYAGTIDRYGTLFGGARCVVDIKTTSSPSREAKVVVCAQTAAYKAAKFGKDQGVKRYAVYLKTDGKYTVLDCEAFEKDSDFDGGYLFNRCLDLYNYFRKAVKK